MYKEVTTRMMRQKYVLNMPCHLIIFCGLIIYETEIEAPLKNSNLMVEDFNFKQELAFEMKKNPKSLDSHL